MSIADKITGMTRREIFNYNFPSAKSGKEFFGTTHRDVRIFAGLILMPEDREKERKRIRENIPKCLR